MKREGDKILFDGPEQQATFETALAAGDAACDWSEAMLAAVGKAKKTAAGCWGQIARAVPLGPGEKAVYSWVTRELTVRREHDTSGDQTRLALEAARTLVAVWDACSIRAIGYEAVKPAVESLREKLA